MSTLNDTESNKRVGFGMLSLMTFKVGGSGYLKLKRDQVSRYPKISQEQPTLMPSRFVKFNH